MGYSWYRADPVTTLVFSIIVFWTTTNIVKDCMSVLMEACPKNVDLREIGWELKKIKGVWAIHDLHVW